MNNPWAITDTFELIGISENIKTPATFLTDVWFPNKLPVSLTKYIAVEYRKENRVLAPYIVKGSRGVNINREGSKVAVYSPPLIAPRRTIGLNDIEMRQFGETPAFSTMTPADRAAQQQAADLVTLKRIVQNRKNEMASKILQYGKLTVKDFSDSGERVVEDEIKFEWDGRTKPLISWDNANATIYADIKAASDKIQEECGVIPTMMICGRNVEKYLLKNTELLNWLMIQNRTNLAMASFAPRYDFPQARYIGTINALGLEVYSYYETYIDDDGETKPFIDDDTVIIGVPGRGRQLYGVVTYLDNGGDWLTAAAEEVPVYNFNTTAQVSSLTLYSRCLLVPEETSDWVTIKVKGDL